MSRTPEMRFRPQLDSLDGRIVPSATAGDPGSGAPPQAAAASTADTLGRGDWFLLAGVGDAAVYLTAGQDGNVWLVSSVESDPEYIQLGSMDGGQFTAAEWIQSAAQDPPFAQPVPANPNNPPTRDDLPPRKVDPPPIKLGPPIAPKPPAPGRADVKQNPDRSITATFYPPAGSNERPIKITIYPFIPGQRDRITIDNGGPLGPIDIHFGP